MTPPKKVSDCCGAGIVWRSLDGVNSPTYDEKSYCSWCLFGCTQVEAKEEEISKCKLCGEPMPRGEEMFYYHGYSGACPKPPLKEAPAPRPTEGWIERFDKEFFVERETTSAGVEFQTYGAELDGEGPAVKPLKSFIAAELAKKDEEHERNLHEKIAKVDGGWIRHFASERAELIEKIKEMKAKRDNPKNHPLVSYGDVCDEILALLSPNEDKLKPRE